MARSINCVYYRNQNASHNLVCQELCRVLLSRGHSVMLVLSEDATSTASRQKLVVRLGQISSQPLEAVASTGPSQPSVEARWLRSQKAQVVISAAVPQACAAAAAAGVCAVCVAHSTGEAIDTKLLGDSLPDTNPWDNGIGYAMATTLLRLPGYAPMLAFNHIVDVPLVVPHAKLSKEEVYAHLHLPITQHALVTTGGQLHTDQHPRLPQGWTSLQKQQSSRGKEPEEVLSDGCQLETSDVDIADMVNAASCVLGMLDYSTASLCLAHSTPYIYIKQGLSGDEPFICSLLHRQGLGLEMPLATYHSGQWGSYLDQALALATSTYSEPTNGAEVVADILEHIGQEKGPQPHGLGPQAATALQASLRKSGSIRLKDALMVAHMMVQESAGQQVHIPAWYTGEMADEVVQRALSESSHLVPALHVDISGTCQLRVPKDEVASVQAQETQAFLKQLTRVVGPAHTSTKTGSCTPILFHEGEVHVAYASSCVSLFGGSTVEYSGGLALAAATARTCHAACHVQTRLPGTSQDAAACIRLCSTSASSQDCDVAEAAAADLVAAQRQDNRVDSAWWMKVVAETLQELHSQKHGTTEPTLLDPFCGISSVSILVQAAREQHTEVAAAVVAVVKAVASALDFPLPPQQAALCCSKVMSQSCNPGGCPSLVDFLAVCMAAEGCVAGISAQQQHDLRPVPLPPQLALWHVSTGGSPRSGDGLARRRKARVAACMGLRIMSEQAAQLAKQGSIIPHPYPERQLSKLHDTPPPLGNGFLANVPAGQFSQLCEAQLPAAMTGVDFLQAYGEHYDRDSQVSSEVGYQVAICTRHVVWEHQRAEGFQQLLQGPLTLPEHLLNLGELLFQSHASQGQCGLTSPAADQLVGRVQRAALLHTPGEFPKLYGASSVGHADPGMVCVLTAAGDGGQQAVNQVIQQLNQELLGGELAHIQGSCKPQAHAANCILHAAHSLRLHITCRIGGSHLVDDFVST